MKQYTNLRDPINIGSVTIKNRMMMAPMDTGFGNTEWGGFTQEGIDYFVRRAEGGFGLLFSGGTNGDCVVDGCDGILNTETSLVVSEQDTESISGAQLQKGTGDFMDYDFSIFDNVEITGIELDSLSDEERSVLFRQAEYCQAMTDADIDKMREIISEDMTFTHMSGRRQSREEYFADIEKGRLNYFTIGIENPSITVDGNVAEITFTSILNANAYGARGTYRMTGTHRYEKRDGEWIAVNR